MGSPLKGTVGFSTRVPLKGCCRVLSSGRLDWVPIRGYCRVLQGLYEKGAFEIRIVGLSGLVKGM